MIVFTERDCPRCNSKLFKFEGEEILYCLNDKSDGDCSFNAEGSEEG